MFSAAKLGRRSRKMRDMIKCMEDSVMEQALHGLLSLNPDISSEIMSTVMKQKTEDSQDSKKLSQKSESPPLDLSPPSLSNDSLLNSLNKSNLSTPVGSVCHSPVPSSMGRSNPPPGLPLSVGHPFANPMLFSLGQDMISSAMYYGAPPLFSQQGSSSPINLVKAERKLQDDRSPIRGHDPLMSPRHRPSSDAINSFRNRSSIDSVSAISHQSSYDNEDLESLDALSRRTSYDFSDEEIQALNARHLHNPMGFDPTNFPHMANKGSNPFRRPQCQAASHRPEMDHRPPSLETGGNSRPSSVASQRASPYLSRSHNPSPFQRNDSMNKSLTLSSPSPYQMAQGQSMTSPPLYRGDLTRQSSGEAVRPMSRQDMDPCGDRSASRQGLPIDSISDTRSTSRQGQPIEQTCGEAMRSLSQQGTTMDSTGDMARSFSRQGRPMVRQSPVSDIEQQEDRRKVMKLSIDSAKMNKPKETAIVSPTVKVEDESQLSVAYLTYKVHQSFQTNFRSRADIQAMQEKVIEFKQRSMMGKQDMQLMFQVGKYMKNKVV